MCIAVFLWQAHPVYPFLLLHNRDEYHNRDSKALAWWDDGEILGGRDLVAGGTWLACSRDGRVAFVTNVRELQSVPLARSRGDLPVRFLQSKKTPVEFAEEVMKEAHEYNGFNLILIDICSRTMLYITNRPTVENSIITEVLPGIHVLSNARLDSPWPKAQRLGSSFKEIMDEHGEDEVPIQEMVENLMFNTVKDDESLLPHIYPPQKEYHLSSIYVDVDTPLGRYGTRSISAFSVKTSGEVNFHEKYRENELWKEQTVTYQIDNKIK